MKKLGAFPGELLRRARDPQVLTVPRVGHGLARFRERYDRDAGRESLEDLSFDAPPQPYGGREDPGLRR